MDEPLSQITPSAAPIETLSFWSRHRYLLMIALTIIVALGLVVISLVIYKASGAAQLDLSRPGYLSVSDQKDDTAAPEYTAYGPLDQESISQFQTMFTEQAAKATAVDAFGGDPLHPDVLEFSVATAE